MKKAMNYEVLRDTALYMIIGLLTSCIILTVVLTYAQCKIQQEQNKKINKVLNKK